MSKKSIFGEHCQEEHGEWDQELMKSERHQL